ncbi:hypothetical protein [Bacillus alkalicellulosilyticus]|uniref:hypothetical protein n=1 Tax=Alkalihalobacterium alkalicellulosilyticum TaxID=1912214 RepID=UPI0009963470|nr:hypothetical protein [Bacillus alkalicellulosilyticus]
MKKVLYITILLGISIVISACGDNSIPPNTIVAAELSDREKGILSTTSVESFVFDFRVDSDYKEASVWIEKYEFGKLVDDQVGHTTTAVTEKGSIIFATNRPNEIPNQTIFNIGVTSNGITGSYSIADIISNQDTDGMSILWGSITEEIDITKGELVLGSIYYSRDEGNMSSISTEFYKDVEGRINEIKDYAVVYLIKSDFSK